jgi:hypothetical protein
MFSACAQMMATVKPSHHHRAGSPMPKRTKRTIDATEPQATEFFIRDESIPGFGLRVMPSGRKSFVVQYGAGRRLRLRTAVQKFATEVAG